MNINGIVIFAAHAFCDNKVILVPLVNLLAAGAVDAVLRGHGAVEGGDAVAVRVAGGVAELGGDSLFKVFGDEVFEAFGFVVEFTERVAEDFEEEGFDKAVVADDF